MSGTDRPRSARWVDRLIVLGVVALVGIAVFAVFSDPPGAPARDVPIGDAPSPVRVTAVTVAASSVATSTPTSTVIATTTHAPTTTTPTTPTAEVVAAICESLRSDGLETRRVMADALADAFTSAGGRGDGRVEVAEQCGDELRRLDGAVEIRDRLQAIDIAEEDDLLALSFTDLSCRAGTFEVVVTNDTSTPLGLHANFAMYRDGDDEAADGALQSSLTPIVIWSLEPGASETIAGRFADPPDGSISCNVEGQVFDADPTSADASIGAGSGSPVEPEYPELTGDDPSEWFPALREVERAARSSGEIDLVAVTEDVRSMSYDEAASAISEGLPLPDSEILEICERGRSQPDTDHLGFVYLERIESGETRLLHAIFRRGADGQWRSLSTPRYFDSLAADDCSAVDPPRSL